MNNSCKIGIMALILAVIAGMSSGLAALYFQISNFFPILGEFSDFSFMQNLSHNHARMMVFFVLQPALMIGFGAWLVPTLIAAKEMAFRNINYTSIFLLFVGFLFNFITFFKPDVTLFAIFGLGCWACSALLFSINMLVTIINYRSKELLYSTLPFFVWTQGVASVLLIPTASIFLATLTRDYWNYSSELSWALQQSVQVFAYPMLMILLVPSLGIVFHIVASISNHAIKHFFISICLLSTVTCSILLLWNKIIFDHHLWQMTQQMEQYTIIYSLFAYALYGLSLYLLAICMYSFIVGKRKFPTPVLWSFGFSVLIVIGWPLKGILSETTNIHSCLSYAVLYTIFAGFYLWMGKLFGRVYSEILGKIHFGITSIGVFFMLNFLGIGAQSILIGSSFLGLSLLVFGVVLLQAFKNKVPLPKNYWGEEARTCEWRLPSPIFIRSK